MKKKALVLLIFFLILVPAAPPVKGQVDRAGFQAAGENRDGFPDVPELHWAAEKIKILAVNKYVRGYDDGTFLPDKLMTRAELASILIRASEEKPLMPEKPSFSDVGKEWWFYSTVETAKVFFSADSSFSQGAFRPHDPVTRQEAVAAIVRAKKLQPDGADPLVMSAAFTDQDRIAPECRDAIARALKYRLVSGYPDKTFRPDSPLTRAEAVSLIFNAFFSEMSISDLLKTGAITPFEKTPEEFGALAESLNNRFGSWEGVKIDFYVKETAVAGNRQDKPVLVLARVDPFKYFTFSDAIFKPEPGKIRQYAEKISAVVSRECPGRRNIVMVCFFDLIYYDTVAEVYGREYTRYSPPDRGWRIERFYAGAMSRDGRIADTWLATVTT